MADQPKKDAPVSTVSGSSVTAETEYVVEHAPKLPTANVTVERSEPLIDKKLIEVRDAEAKAQADRLK